VVTHEPREPLSKHGGTTYIFASDGIEAALEQARAAAGEKNVGIWGHEPNAATDLRFRTTYEN